MKIISPPYLRPYFERVKVKDWLTLRNGEVISLGDLMPEWDAATSVKVILNIEIDVQGVLLDCRLPKTAQLRLVSTWTSSGTGLRGCGSSKNVDTQLLVQSVYLELSLEGSLLASELTLGVSLILNAPISVAERAAPKMLGSLLWKDSRKVTLEGQGARFPVEMIDFGKSLSWLPENAGWFLDWDRTDFSRPVLGYVRLYINSNHKRIKAAVSGTEESDQPIREAMQFDVAKNLIMTALDNDEFLEDHEKYEEETIGAAIRRLIRALFKNTTFRELQQYRQQYPERFECELQDKFGLFRED